jgi:hypothetical protein
MSKTLAGSSLFCLAPLIFYFAKIFWVLPAGEGGERAEKARTERASAG